jgi:opacity protein-like surface antigen
METKMKNLAVALGAAIALSSGSAAAQTYGNELSFFGSYDSMDEPEDVTLSVFHLRYGKYLTSQAVAVIGISRTNFDVSGAADSTTTAVTGGAKYYFGQQMNRGFMPFVEAAIGIASTDTGAGDSTDLTWELGGGASFFMSDATSFDASARWYQTDTDGGDTEGLRIFLGMTTRF